MTIGCVCKLKFIRFNIFKSSFLLFVTRIGYEGFSLFGNINIADGLDCHVNA